MSDHQDTPRHERRAHPRAAEISHQNRITITFIPKALAAVDRLTASEGMTKAEVVNRGVQLYAFLETEKANGKRVALIDKQGNVETVAFL